VIRFVWVGGKRHPHLLWRLSFLRWELWWARPMCFGVRDQECETLFARYSPEAIDACRAA